MLVVGELLVERAAEPVERAAVDLTFGDHRIDDRARVVHGHVAQDLDRRGLGIDLHRHHLGDEAVRVGRVHAVLGVDGLRHREPEHRGRLQRGLHPLGQRLGVPVRAPCQVLDRVRRPLAGPQPHGAVAKVERGHRQLHQVRRVVHELGLQLPGGQGDGARPHRPEAARVRAGRDRPHARERVHLVDDRDVLRIQSQLVGDDLRHDRLVALALRRRAEDRDDPPERVDLDRRRVDGAGLRKVLGLRAELRVERRGHVAHVRHRWVDGECQPDPHVPSRRACPRLLPAQFVVSSQLERLVEDGWIIAAVVEPARRGAIRELVGLHEVPSADFDRIQSEPVGEPVHHALGLEIQVAAGVAAIGPGEALVGHDHGRIDLEILEAVRADKVSRRTKATTWLRAADVTTDIVQPLEPHAEDRAVLPRRDLTVGNAIRPARRGQQMLAAVLDPFDRYAQPHRGERDQRDVWIDRRLDAERAADVRRHDEAQLVLHEAQHPRGQRMHDERPHEVRPDRAHAVERIPARDHTVRLDRRRAVLGKREALGQDDVGLAKRALGIAVDQPSVARQVRADRRMQDGRRRIERALGIDDHRQRIVVDPDEIGGVLGDVAILGDHDGDRLADEPHPIRRGAVVVDRRRHADREGLGVPRDVRAGDRANDAVERQRRRQVVAADRRVGQRRAHDCRVARVGDRRVIVDVGPATGEEPRVLDALDRLPDPAHLGH